MIEGILCVEIAIACPLFLLIRILCNAERRILTGTAIRGDSLSWSDYAAIQMQFPEWRDRVFFMLRLAKYGYGIPKWRWSALQPWTWRQANRGHLPGCSTTADL
jgi:hypothetical protein